MSNPNDPRVTTARNILHERPPVDLSDHGAVINRMGRLEAAVSMLLETTSHPADMADMVTEPHQLVANEYGTVYTCRMCDVAVDRPDIGHAVMYEPCPGPRTRR